MNCCLNSPQVSRLVGSMRPILLGSILTLALGPLNKEFLIPTLARQLTVPRDDPDLSRKVEVKGAYDSTGVHMEGYAADRKALTVIWMYLTFSEKSDSGMLLVTVKEAIYTPPGDGQYTGGWLLNQVQTELEDTILPANLEKISNGRYFLRTRDVDFDAITRGASWFNYASTPQLRNCSPSPTHADSRQSPSSSTVGLHGH